MKKMIFALILPLALLGILSGAPLSAGAATVTTRTFVVG